MMGNPDQHAREGWFQHPHPSSQMPQGPRGDFCQLMFVHWDWKVPKSCK